MSHVPLIVCGVGTGTNGTYNRNIRNIEVIKSCLQLTPVIQKARQHFIKKYVKLQEHKFDTMLTFQVQVIIN